LNNNITIHLRINVYCNSIQQRLGAKIKYLDVKIPNSIILKIQITRNLIFVKLNNGGACGHVWSTACSEIKKKKIDTNITIITTCLSTVFYFIDVYASVE